MSENWTMPKWMYKYCKYINSSQSLDTNEEQILTTSIENIEKYVNEEIEQEEYTIVLFNQLNKVQIQVQLLEKLYNKGIIK